MKRLVKSRQTGIFCTQCDKSTPVNTSRIIDGGMHSHYECLNKGFNMSDWISVDDRLPITEKDMIDGDVKYSEVDVIGYDGVSQFQAGNTLTYWGCFIEEGITQWAPLPEPPKE